MTWTTALSSTHQNGSVIQDYGSRVIVAKFAPVDLRVYRIEGGVKKLATTLRLDPTTRPQAAVTATIRGGEAVVELVAPNFANLEHELFMDERENREIAFKVPAKMGCNFGGSFYRLSDERELLHYWILETDDVNLNSDEESK